jgi:uncharacterized protein
MLVGLYQIELFLPDSGSLKSKRFVLKSLKDKIRSRFNVSVAEVENNELWQRAVLGVAMVCNERKFIDQVMAQIFNLVSQEDQVEITNQQLEII